MQADALVSGSCPVEMCAAQAHRRQQAPAADLDLALRHVGRLGIDFCKSDLRARQALLGRRQQPPHGFCAVAFDPMVIVVRVADVQGAEVEQRGAVFRIERRGEEFLATRISGIAIFPREGGRDEVLEAALRAAFEKGGSEHVTRLYRRNDLPEERCWLRAPGWCLTYE